MKMLIDLLPWDSVAFGYPVGRVAWDHSPTSETVTALSVEARRKRLRLVYCSWPGKPDEKSKASKWFSYVGGHQCYAIRRRNFLSTKTEAKGISICLHPTAALRQLALASGRFSRFALDPNFQCNEFRTLYHRWLQRAFGKGREGICCVAGSANDPDGFLTLETANDMRHPVIGLLAVHERCRRTGTGSRLLDFARILSFHAGAAELMVKTQLDNKGGMAFYERNGFVPVSVQSVAHFWSEFS
ncbi:MAG: GNAT family N-acetyltransferase [Kiritimatiellae bacterium]|nr:GNAT family N-acetyltransferase [Kiritimatiellia bacterium]